MTTVGDRDGATYDHALDFGRLNRQARQVADVMADGRWHTLGDIALVTGASEASISARLRDMRKERFGGFNIERRRDPDQPGVWWYRLNGVIPALALAPSKPTRAQLEGRLAAVTALCEQAATLGATHLRVESVRAAAEGS